MRKNLLIVALSVVVALGAACGDGDGPTTPDVSFTPAPAPSLSAVSPTSSETVVVSSAAANRAETGTVKIRVAHLSTDAPAVDVWVNGRVALSNVAFKTVTGYLELPEGEYRLQVTPAGETEPVVIDATVPLRDGNVYTVAAVGFLSSTIEPLILLDSSRIGEGARIRVVHASADTGGVDLAVTGGPILVENLTFQKASEYLEVPGGTYDLEVRATGTRTAALAIPGLEVSNGIVYSVFAVGRSYNETLEALPIADAP